MNFWGHDSEKERLGNCALSSSFVMIKRLHITLCDIAQMVRALEFHPIVVGSIPTITPNNGEFRSTLEKMVGRIAKSVKREKVRCVENKTRRKLRIKDQNRINHIPTFWVMAPLILSMTND